MIDLERWGAPAFSLSVAGDVLRFTGLNRRAEAMSGLSAAVMTGRRPAECLPSHVAEIVTPHYSACAAGRVVCYEEEFALPIGCRIVRTVLTPIFGPDGLVVTEIFGTAEDVTIHRAAAVAAREEQARAELALEAIGGGFWHYDARTGAFETSRQLGRFLTGDDVVLDLQAYVARVVPEDLSQTDLVSIAKARIPVSEREYRMQDRNGELRWMRCKRRLLCDETGEPLRIVGVAFDVTEQKLAQSRLEREVATDPLTGLCNRRSFDAEADRLWRGRDAGEHRLGVLLVDVDHFKQVNDRYGHAAGDRVLQAVAAVLKGQVRPFDVAARLGGDEFGILIDGADEGTLARLATRLSGAFEAPLEVDGVCVPVSVSVGGALSAPDDTSFAHTLRRADVELYKVKEGGRASWKLAA